MCLMGHHRVRRPPACLPVRSHVDFAWSEGKATFNSTVSDTDTIS